MALHRSLPSHLRALFFLLVSLFLILPALWPLIVFPYFDTEGHDGMLHLWRMWEFDRLWQLGAFIGRWAPDFNFAFGSPIFNFYNPLSYLLGEFLMGWGWGAHQAIRGVLGLSLGLAFSGMFLLGREWNPGPYRDRVGLLAAALYVYTPYILADAYLRLALAESLALGLMPFLLWALVRFYRRRERWVLPLASLLGALLLLAHNLTALLSAPFLLLLLLLLSFDRTPRSANRPTHTSAAGVENQLPLLGALSLALAMAAFFWLPMLSEREYVKLENAVGPAGEELYREHTLSPLSYVQPRPIHDYALDFPERGDLKPVPHLGLVNSLFAFMGLIWTLGRNRLGSAKDRFLLVTLLGSLFLVSPGSLPLWDYIPGLAMVQFPWRFLTLTSLVTALLGAGLAETRWLQRPSLFLLALAAVMLSGIGKPAWKPLDWQPGWTNQANYLAFERQSYLLGMTAHNEFLPRWSMLPLGIPWENPKSEEKETPTPQVQLLKATPLSLQLAIHAEEGSPLTLDQLYFPSFKATLDGRPARGYPGYLGLLTVDVPPGSHELSIEERLTPPQALGSFLSLLAWPVWLVALLWLAGNKRARMALALGLGLVALAAAPSLAKAFNGPSKYSYTAIPSEKGAVSKNLQLLGYLVDQSNWASTGLLGIDFFFLTANPPKTQDTVRLRIREPSQERLIVDSEHLLFEGLRPLQGLGSPMLVRDRVFVHLPPDFLGGEIGMEVSSSRDLSQPVGSLSLPPRGTPLGEGALILPPQRSDVLYGGQLILRRGTSLPLKPLEEGSTFLLPLSWTKMVGATGQFTAVASLENKQGMVFAEASLTMESQEHRWHWGTLHTISIPDDLPPDAYWLNLRVLTPEGRTLPSLSADGRRGDYQSLAVGLMGMRWGCAPQGVSPLQADFGTEIRLLGAILDAKDGKVDLTLCWQALSRITEDYHVFVHLLDRHGNRLAQWDGHPQGGFAKTSKWRLGEVVAESYRFFLPEEGGPFSFQIGLYLLKEAGPNEYVITRRLKGAGGLDAFTLGPFAPDLP